MAETIYICNEDASNKFWSYSKVGGKVTFKWGRIGGTTKDLVKDFGSPARAQAEIDDKIKEKTRKGYKLVTEDKLKEEAETAQELGIRNKIKRILWVSRKGNELKQIDNYDSKQYVYVEILNSYEKHMTRMLLSTTGTWIIDGGVTEVERTLTLNTIRDVPNDYHFGQVVRKFLKKMAEVVVAALKTIKVGAIGKRDLFDEDACESVPEVATVLASIDSSGAEIGVIRKIAAMGARVLEL